MELQCLGIGKGASCGEEGSPLNSDTIRNLDECRRGWPMTTVPVPTYFICSVYFFVICLVSQVEGALFPLS
jgi:hypothetical protein